MKTLKIKKLNPKAKAPTYANPGDVALDFYALKKYVIKPKQRVLMETGIAIQLPKGCAGLMWEKSGLSNKHGLKLLGGVIDESYRGEIMIGLVNLGSASYTIEAGDKAAQMLIQKIERVQVKEVTELSSTKRGTGGFGSTGKK